VARMGKERVVYRVLVGKPEGKRPLGRPRRRWEDNIKMDVNVQYSVQYNVNAQCSVQYTVNVQCSVQYTVNVQCSVQYTFYYFI
jgi:hypothetical protein